MMNKTIIIATGGTGGHVFPAQALSDQLKQKGYNPVLFYDERASKFLNGSFKNIPKHQLKTSQFSKGFFQKINSLNYLIINVYKTIFYFLKIKPKYVVGFGGYPAFPCMVAAMILFIPIIMYEPNAVIGRVNRWFLPFAKKLAVFTKNTKGIHPKYHYKTQVVGNIVREEIAKLATQTRKADKKFNLLIIGGSQGAQIFSDIVPKTIALLSDELKGNLNITQQVRPNLIDNTVSAYKEIKVRAIIKPFFEDIGKLYAKADLVICRSGASTISELILFKTPAILVPYPHATDNHQYYNALELSQQGAALLIKQEEFSPSKLAEHLIGLMQDKTSLQKLKEPYSNIQSVNGIDKMLQMLA